MTQFRFFVLLAGLTLLVSAPLLSQEPLQKVDINRAGTTQLLALPGIGPALAQRIVDHRTKNGPFKRAQDLLNVPGIGPKKFEGLADLVTVGRPPGQKSGDSRAQWLPRYRQPAPVCLA